MTDLILLALATHRLVNLWLWERIAEKPKAWLSARGPWLAYLAGCPMCLSVWAAAVFTVLWFLGGRPGQLIVWLFAASAGMLLVDRLHVLLMVKSTPQFPQLPMPTNGETVQR